MKGQYIYNKGFKCYVTGKMRKLYGAKWHITIYDEGPKEGTINLISERNMKTYHSEQLATN